MKPTYFCSVPVVGEGDLVLFRDAAVTYSACRRHDQALIVEAPAEAWDLLSWLGVEAGAGLPHGIAYLDPQRTPSEGVEARPLAAWNSGRLSLESFRQKGYLAETMFAALIRSSYGPDSLDFFPTRSELGFYFDDSLLLEGEARWNEDYLGVCQAFFMEELMPGELLAKSIGLLPAERRESLLELSSRWEVELQGVTFLVASQLETLLPLARLLSGLLGLNSGRDGSRGLKELVQSVQVWDQPGWTAAWNGQPAERRQALAAELCPEFAEQAEPILFTAGPDLLLWRAFAMTEAMR
jgi:hypothetical protein